MKFLPSQLAYFLQSGTSRRNLQLLRRYFLFLAVLIAAYSVAFHLLMAAEGQRHSWQTGLYWTLTVMTTLGFGDITFQSDAGRLFSVLVLLSGVIFLLVVLPFTFIQFFYAPWLEAQSRNRAPRAVPEDAPERVRVRVRGPSPLIRCPVRGDVRVRDPNPLIRSRPVRHGRAQNGERTQGQAHAGSHEGSHGAEALAPCGAPPLPRAQPARTC